MRFHTAWTALIILLVVVVGALSLLFPLQPEITPGGLGLDIEERDVLTTVSSEYRPELARFAVRFNNVVIPYRVMAIFVMPGERVTIEVPSPAAGSSYQIEPDSGVAVPIGSATWRWHAPSEPGFYPIHIDELATRFSVTREGGSLVDLPVCAISSRRGRNSAGVTCTSSPVWRVRFGESGVYYSAR